MDHRKEYHRLSGSAPPSSPSGDEYIYRSSSRRRPFRHAIAYTILMLLNASLFSLWLNNSSHFRSTHADADCVRPFLTFSPAKAAGVTRYERKKLMRSLNDNPYTGEPRPEHDAGWRKLIEPMTIKLSPEEYAQANLGDDTLALKDGSGYIAEMAVYHELHCIKRIRRHLYLDHYYPNISTDDLHRENVHI
ncbi:MAG: hypothetical protein Q9187_002351, partial [Circinaria calcarea]